MKRRNSELYTALHPALHMENVYRSYVVKGEKHNVLSNLSFDIYPGEVVCLLGPNGAGKTTTVKIASTLLLPDLGTVEICVIYGIKHPRRACDHLSLLLGGEDGFYLRASAKDNLFFFAQVSNAPLSQQKVLIDAALKRVNLFDVRNQLVQTFSRGMRQRLHIARALVAQKNLILLDEPTIGLDPESAADVRQLIAELRHVPSGVLLTTHIMREVELLADRIVVIQEGRSIFQGTLEEMRSSVELEHVSTYLAPAISEEQIENLTRQQGVSSVEVLDKFDSYYVDVAWAASASDTLCTETYSWKEINRRSPSLEEVYLGLLNKRRI
ncbi:ABC transporter ATP-binding protein [Lancefieldella rimae]|uniref:ABC transporter ATP-binding protein n=1 Tax=Lancefieldella rimae TaxID=1383 RepID=UPI003A951909